MISTVVFAGEGFCLADAPDWEDEPPKLVSNRLELPPAFDDALN